LHVARNPAIPITGLDATHDLANIEHGGSPACQGGLLGNGKEESYLAARESGKRRVVPDRPKTGGPLSDENGWSPIGCQRLVPDGENAWPTIARELTGATVGEGRRLRQEVVHATATALAAHHGNKSQAARDLGIHRTTLWRRLRRWGGLRESGPRPT
jgi:hypothetical protein